MQTDKIKLLTEKLIVGGYIYFVTDWAEYADYALSEFASVPNLKNRYNRFAKKQEWRPQTNFERKALQEGRNIYELIYDKFN